MQLLINISKDDFEEICMQARMVEDTDSLFGRIRKAISHSTTLPKGHGRLIDADYLREDFKASKRISFAERMDISCIVDHAPTIIEADEVES